MAWYLYILYGSLNSAAHPGAFSPHAGSCLQHLFALLRSAGSLRCPLHPCSRQYPAAVTLSTSTSSKPRSVTTCSALLASHPAHGAANVQLGDGCNFVRIVQQQLQ